MRACPFCGYDEGWTKEAAYQKPIKYKVECAVCGASGPESFSRELAVKKWDGILSKVESEKKFQEILKEDMGGVSAPMATLHNVPGMGTAVPPSANGIGSGDKWGNDINKKPYTQSTKKTKVTAAKKKKRAKKHVDERQSFVNFKDKCPINVGDKITFHILSGYPANAFGEVKTVSDDVDFRINKGYISVKSKNKIHTVKPWDIVIDSQLKEGNINPYDKGAKLIASQMDHEVEFPFEEIDSVTNTVKQKNYDKKHESAYTNKTYEILTYENFVKKLLEEDTADKEALKYINGKNELKKIGIAFVFKMIDDKHQIAFIKDDMKEVEEKLKEDGWKKQESETKETGKIDKYTKEEQTLSIFTGEFDHPYVTLVKSKEKEEKPEEM